MKTMKKLVSLLLAGAMILSLAACGGNEGASSQSGGSDSTPTSGSTSESSGEPVTVSWWLSAPYEMPLAPQVQEKMNEIAEEKYGIRYELTFLSMGNFATQLNLALASDEVDVFPCGSLFDYKNNGQIADLTEYYEAAPDEFKELWLCDDTYMNSMKIDGKIYGLPHIVDFGHYVSLNLDQEVADKYGITQERELSMAEVDELLAKIHEDFSDRYTLGAGGTTSVFSNGFYTWDNMLDKVGVLPDKGQTTTVESIFDNEDFIYLAKLAEKWYDAGYIMPDILSNTQAWASMLANNQIAAVFDCYGVNFVDGAVRTRIKEVGHWTEGMSISTTAWSVSANSSHPEEAFQSLTLLFTDAELSTYLNNGIEGENYVKNDNGTISYIDGKDAAGSGYGAPSLFWCYPGAEISQPLDVNGPTFFEDLIQFNTEGEFSKINGFFFDPSAVIDEYTACKAVIDKYFGPLQSGAVDVDTTLEQARSEMDAAGEDKVIAEKQRQIDEFLAQQ